MQIDEFLTQLPADVRGQVEDVVREADATVTPDRETSVYEVFQHRVERPHRVNLTPPVMNHLMRALANVPPAPLSADHARAIELANPYHPDAPWSRAGVPYHRFEPDITNPRDTFHPSMGSRWRFIGTRLYIDGEISMAMLDDIIMGEKTVTEVVINSHGGRVDEAMDLAAYIRRNNIRTIIPAGGVCSSAATLVFQAGVERIAHPDAVFMYHGTRVGAWGMQGVWRNTLRNDGFDAALALWNQWAESIPRGTQAMFDALERYGATPALRTRYMSQPDDPNFVARGNPFRRADMELTARELAQYGVVTHFLQTSADQPHRPVPVVVGSPSPGD